MSKDDVFQVISLISKTTNAPLILHLPLDTTKNHLQSILNDHFNTRKFYKFYSEKSFNELRDVHKDESRLEIFYEEVSVFSVDDDVLRARDGYLLCRNGFYRGFNKISDLQKRDFSVDGNRVAFLAGLDCIEVYDMDKRLDPHRDSATKNRTDDQHAPSESAAGLAGNKDFALDRTYKFSEAIAAFLLRNNIMLVACTDGSVHVIDSQKHLLARLAAAVANVEYHDAIFHLISRNGTYLRYQYDENDVQANLTTIYHDRPVTAFAAAPLFVVATTNKLLVGNDEIQLGIRYVKDVKTYLNRIYVCGQHRLIVLEQLKVVNSFQYENEIVGVTMVGGEVYLIEGNRVHEL